MEKKKKKTSFIQITRGKMLLGQEIVIMFFLENKLKQCRIQIFMIHTLMLAYFKGKNVRYEISRGIRHRRQLFNMKHSFLTFALIFFKR